jgi:hypothetical protein
MVGLYGIFETEAWAAAVGVLIYKVLVVQQAGAQDMVPREEMRLPLILAVHHQATDSEVIPMVFQICPPLYI